MNISASFIAQKRIQKKLMNVFCEISMEKLPFLIRISVIQTIIRKNMTDHIELDDRSKNFPNNSLN